MKPIRIEPQALDDLRQAANWYAEIDPSLAATFLDQFERVSQSIEQRPQAFPIYHRKMRRALMMRKFSYIILFVELSDVISIVGVFHTSRDPETIRKRS